MKNGHWCTPCNQGNQISMNKAPATSYYVCQVNFRQIMYFFIKMRNQFTWISFLSWLIVTPFLTINSNCFSGVLQATQISEDDNVIWEQLFRSFSCSAIFFLFSWMFRLDSLLNCELRVSKSYRIVKKLLFRL